MHSACVCALDCIHRHGHSEIHMHSACVRALTVYTALAIVRFTCTVHVCVRLVGCIHRHGHGRVQRRNLPHALAILAFIVFSCLSCALAILVVFITSLCPIVAPSRPTCVGHRARMCSTSAPPPPTQHVVLERCVTSSMHVQLIGEWGEGLGVAFMLFPGVFALMYTSLPSLNVFLKTRPLQCNSSHGAHTKP